MSYLPSQYNEKTSKECEEDGHDIEEGEGVVSHAPHIVTKEQPRLSHGVLKRDDDNIII